MLVLLRLLPASERPLKISPAVWEINQNKQTRRQVPCMYTYIQIHSVKNDYYNIISRHSNFISMYVWINTLLYLRNVINQAVGTNSLADKN